jgi:nucleoside-diphosphate-sugar epimerase
MKVLIAGGSGFIGSALIPKLVKANCFVGVLDVKPLDIGFPLDSYVHFFNGSVCDIPSSVKTLEWDVIINLAAVSSITDCENNPQHAFDVNVSGSRMLLDLALSNDASFILASSAAVYAESSDAFTVSSSVSPISIYGESKLQAENDAFIYATNDYVPVTVFRFFNVFGPNQFLFNPDAVVPNFLVSAVSNTSLKVNNSGLSYRDFVPVDFVSDLIVSTCLSGFSYNSPIPVCTGVSRSILDVANLVSSFNSPSTPVEVSPFTNSQSLNFSLGDPSLVSSLFPDVVLPEFESYLRFCFDFVSKNYN